MQKNGTIHHKETSVCVCVCVCVHACIAFLYVIISLSAIVYIYIIHIICKYVYVRLWLVYICVTSCTSMSESVCACEHTSQTFHSLAALIVQTHQHQNINCLGSSPRHWHSVIITQGILGTIVHRFPKPVSHNLQNIEYCPGF